MGNIQTISGTKTFSTAPIFSTMTVGSVLFAGTGGTISQDNSNLYWDDTNNRLGIGTNSLAGTLNIGGNITGNPSTYGLLLTNTFTFTDNSTAASGTATTMFAVNIAPPTLAATNASVITTTAATLNIAGAPIKGTNNTVATTAALNIAAGAVGAQTTSYGLICNAQTGATNNYAALFQGGDIVLNAVTGSPRQIIFNNVGGGTYPGVGGATIIKSQYGDFYWQSAGGVGLQMAAWHEVILQGGRNTNSSLSFITGNNATYNTRIINSASGQIALTIEGPSGQSGDLQRWIVNSSTLSVVNSAGYLGIGNTSPSQPLHVTGNARVTGAFYDSSNSAGSSGEGLLSTGTGTNWSYLPGSSNWLWIISDQKTNGTDAGTFTSGAWRIRTLNTLDGSSDNSVTLASDRFTLVAGTYFIKFRAPAYGVGGHQARLYNYTTSAVTEYGSSECAVTSCSTNSLLALYLTVASSTAYRVEHRCTTTVSTTGLGNAAGFGGTEIYTLVEVMRLS